MSDQGPSLDLLAENREGLLLAELGALLHDMGKATDEFVRRKRGFRYKILFTPEELKKRLDEIAHSVDGNPYWKNGEDKWPGILDTVEAQESLYKVLTDGNIPLPTLLDSTGQLRIGDETHSFTIRELILFSEPRFIFDGPDGAFGVGEGKENLYNQLKCGGKARIHQYLARAHGAAHIEKEDPKAHARDVTRQSNPFGVEGSKLEGLTERLLAMLRALPATASDFVEERDAVSESIKTTLQSAIADRRLPINEVTVWDWGHIVAALYRAALAGAILAGTLADPLTLKWRFLTVRFDGQRAVEHIASIPALLARKAWLSRGLDGVRRLLEWEFPVGTEVYRDENGSIFVIPDRQDLLDLTASGRPSPTVDELPQTLRALIRKRLAFDGELLITPEIDAETWWAQKPDLNNATQQDEIPPMGQHLSAALQAHADPAMVERWWAEAPQAFPCSVSLVRPQSPCIAATRKMSKYWFDQVNGRAKQWWEMQEKGETGETIWLDEVADINGRVCIIVGRIALEGWLGRPSMLSSIRATITSDNTEPDDTANVEEGSPKHPGKRASFARMYRVWETTRQFWARTEEQLSTTVGVVPSRLRLRSGAQLNNNYAYELDLGGIRLGVCYRRNSDQHTATFLSTVNLPRVARLLGASTARVREVGGAADYIRDELRMRGEVPLWEPGGYGTEGIQRGTVSLTTIEMIGSPYIPAVVLQRDPRSFIAVLPADRALAAAEDIRKRYDAEFGKVRNRLPLVLGLCFADARTPLPALLDAGRRMLLQRHAAKQWVVRSKVDTDLHVQLDLEQGARQVQLNVPTTMGDNKQDHWYTYWRVTSKDDSPDTFRRGDERWRRIQALKPGDTVYYMPSPIDFAFLDTAARRFEIVYDADGRRRGSATEYQAHQLEHLPELIELWRLVKRGLSTSAIKNLIGIIETKRVEWQGYDASIFTRFVAELVHDADWIHRPDAANLKRLTDAAQSGLLAEVVDLHMSVIKEVEEIDRDDHHQR